MSDIRAVAYELSNSDGETIIIRSERHQVESYKHRYSTDLVNELVRKSEAQTQIAARDTEIVRLREALEILENANNNLCFMRSNDTYQSMMRDGCGDLLEVLDRARLGAREALKGGAA